MFVLLLFCKDSGGSTLKKLKWRGGSCMNPNSSQIYELAVNF